MRRVYTVYILKMVARPLIIELAIVAALIMFVSLFVSFQNIFANALSIRNAMDFGRFILDAFTHTQFTVQVLSLLLVATAIGFLYDSIRRIRNVFVFTYQ